MTAEVATGAAAAVDVGVDVGDADASTLVCRTPFNYWVPALEESQPVVQSVRDGRQLAAPGWEVCGFELMRHASAVCDWDDEAEIKRIHYAEISALACELTGCDSAVVTSHILRNPEQAKLHEDLAPIQFVHSDFAANYGDLLRRHYAGDDAEVKACLDAAGVTPADMLSAKRMLIIQFWRNVGPAVMDLPIAFCDARSVQAADVVPLLVEDYAGGGFNFDTLAVLAPEDDQHQWYTFPAMQPDEVVAFRTYDSERVDSERPFWTPHSAYKDPKAQPDTPARHSIELRATCLYQ